MKKWTEELLIKEGYKLINAEIKNVSLNMLDHGVLTLDLTLEGSAWGVVYGGYVLGKGYVGAEEFEGYDSGTEAIMRIMDTIGVSDLIKAKGKYVRVASKGLGSSVKIIGNLINNKWFDYETFFEDKRSKKE